MKYDLEKLESDLLALVKSKMAVKLSEIEADKGDSITLEVPADDQYFNSTDIDEEIVNQVLMVRYGIEESDAISISSATSQESTVSFLVYLNELNQARGVLRKKIFRYGRALKEIFEENFRDLSFVSNMNIEVVSPMEWRENESSPAYKVGGVFIKATLAS